MAKPKLTREECADIRKMYADRSRHETTFTIAKLFRHVTPGTINLVLNSQYTPLEDYEEKQAAKRRGRRNLTVRATDAYEEIVREQGAPAAVLEERSGSFLVFSGPDPGALCIGSGTDAHEAWKHAALHILRENIKRGL